MGNDTTLCFGQTLTLNATNTGATYQWQDGSTNPTYNVSTAGIYSVTVSVGACTASGSINVAVAPAVTVSLGNDTTLCGGQSFTLNAGNPGATYVWQDGSALQTYNVNATGTYSVTATETGCSASGSIQVTFATPPVINLGNDTTLCTGQTLTLSATTAGATYLWQDASSAPTYSVSSAGNYSVTVTVGSLCTATGNTTGFIRLSRPQLTSVATKTLCNGPELQPYWMPQQQVLLTNGRMAPRAQLIWLVHKVIIRSVLRLAFVSVQRFSNNKLCFSSHY